MTLYAILKFLHVAPVIIAVGANVTYAFWLRAAGRDRERLLFTIPAVRRLDRRVANPAYIVILLTGLAMVAMGPYDFGAGWVTLSLILYVAVAIFGIAVFAPAIRRQLAEAERDPSSDAYATAATRSLQFAGLAVAITFVIVFLMVTKPF